MSTTKKLTNITAKQISDKGIQALANRPNASAQYGVGGLSPTQLKLWFDKLATFLADKINEIQDALSSDEAGNYIRLPLDDYGISNIGDLQLSFLDGSFADKVLQVFPSASDEDATSLQAVIYSIADSLSNNAEKLDETNDLINGIREKIFNLQVAPPISALSNSVLLCTPTLAQLAVSNS